MKMAILSAVAAFLCLGVGNAALQGPAAYLEFPVYRFLLWDDLTDALRLSAVGLNYTQSTWELPLTNAIEFKPWYLLGEVDKSNAADMGYDKDVWNCYQNHYTTYRWIALQAIGVAQYYEVFGWDEDSWNGETDEPLDWYELWADLTPDLQDAAKELCYFRAEIWDEETFVDWVSFPPEITLTDVPAELPSTYAKLQGPVAYLDFPFYRYVLWNDLTDALRMSAVGLNYTQATWELPLANDIESSPWYSLEEIDKSNAAAIGYDENVWDCYQNHYFNYQWIELKAIGVAQYYEAFGWDEDSWNGITAEPSGWVESWADLTDDLQDAARELCFFRSEVWDGGTPFQLWAQTASPTSMPSALPSSSPNQEPTAAPTDSSSAPSFSNAGRRLLGLFAGVLLLA
jgi:hypothetical protein